MLFARKMVFCFFHVFALSRFSKYILYIVFLSYPIFHFLHLGLIDSVLCCLLLLGESMITPFAI